MDHEMINFVKTFLPYVSALIFSFVALYGKPNGGLILTNIIMVFISLLILMVASSDLSETRGEIDLNLGGMFDYSLFKSTKWWVFFLPIVIMAIRIPKFFMVYRIGEAKYGQRGKRKM